MKSTYLSLLILTLASSLAACGRSNASTSASFDAGLRRLDGAVLDSGIVLPSPDATVPTGGLQISPMAPVLTVTTGVPVPTLQFTATIAGVTATGVAWSFDNGAIGVVNSSGLFTPTGVTGGVENITAAVGVQSAATTITVNLQGTDNGDPGWSANPTDGGPGGYGGVGGNGPGGPPDAGQTATLNGATSADSTVKLLYPYDGTVWPKGLLAPLLQWDPGAHSFDSAYVHISSPNYDYKGYFAANATPFVNLPIPEAAWQSMTLSNGGQPVSVAIIFAEGASAYGPYTETWTIAQADLHGTIYYNSYGTGLVQNSDSNDFYGTQYGAGTLSISTGNPTPVLVAGISSKGQGGTGCRVCHTVAGNGQSLVTQASNANATDYTETVAINLANDTTGGAGTPLAVTNLTYPAISKDGTLLFSSSVGLTYPGAVAGTPSLLYWADGGVPVSGVTGLPTGFEAALPAFSPDGKHLSFNFWAGSAPASGSSPAVTGDELSLGILDFDGVSAFSNARILFTPKHPGAVTYSSFLPDSSGIVFEVELSNPSNGWGYTWRQNTGELWVVDIATAKATRLDSLNGYGAGGTIYLPAQTASATQTHTPAQDVTLNYEPTLNPIASGGYAWVVFTSRRLYGNVAQLDPWQSDPRAYKWRDEITDKKLWVAAVDLGAAPGTDSSHPAFYLPAQELHAGNARGYWTVTPCLPSGQDCSTGDQCCGGYCEAVPDGGFSCTAQVPTCSAQYDKCTQASDCCSGQGLQCINGVCTLPAPP